MNDNLKGALLMMLSMFAFLINDVFMKLLSPDLPLFQAIFVRGVFTSFILLCLLYTSPSPRDRTRSRMPSSA